MPLVLAGQTAADDTPAPSEARERALKIKPEFARGPLVRVAGGRNQAEAELIQNMLLEEGIPSMFKRSAAFDVPDMLAAGDRDVLVPESGAEAAHDLLLDAELMPSASIQPMARPNAIKLLVAFVVGAAIATLIAWALVALAG
jgi:pimeloyl-ACP methyl ester carboxylesterase